MAYWDRMTETEVILKALHDLLDSRQDQPIPAHIVRKKRGPAKGTKQKGNKKD
jgi:hypothetical protein